MGRFEYRVFSEAVEVNFYIVKFKPDRFLILSGFFINIF